MTIEDIIESLKIKFNDDFEGNCLIEDLERLLLTNRYQLFVYDQYYPSGGLGDIVQEYDSLEIAIESTKKLYSDDAYIR